MKIAVAGGGIAGLAAAIALSRRGFAVEVHERMPEAREIGAGIQLSPNAMTVLRRLGLEAAVLEFASEPQAIEIRDGPSARLLTRIPLGSEARRRYGAPYCVIRRADLHAILLAAAQASEGVEIHFGSEVEAVQSGASGVTFARNRETHRADLLVAADGINSGLRAASGLSPPRDIGKTAWRATIPAELAAETIDTAVTGLWFGRGAHLVHYPVNRGAEINVVVIGPNMGGSEGPPLASFDEHRMRMACAWSVWTEWPLRVIDSGPWVRGRMVLVGDAAHAMVPSAAQGGAQAIEDAWFLADSLPPAPSDVPAALGHFEAIRRPRVARVASESRRNLAIYNLSGINALARNAVVAAMPVSMHQSRLDWLYRLPSGQNSA